MISNQCCRGETMSGYLNTPTMIEFWEGRSIYYPMNFQNFLEINKRKVKQDAFFEFTLSVLRFKDDMPQPSQFEWGIPDNKYVAPLVYLFATWTKLAHVNRAIILTTREKVCFIRNTRPSRSYVHSVPADAVVSEGEYIVDWLPSHQDLHGVDGW